MVKDFSDKVCIQAICWGSWCRGQLTSNFDAPGVLKQSIL